MSERLKKRCSLGKWVLEIAGSETYNSASGTLLSLLLEIIQHAESFFQQKLIFLE